MQPVQKHVHFYVPQQMQAQSISSLIIPDNVASSFTPMLFLRQRANIPRNTASVDRIVELAQEKAFLRHLPPHLPPLNQYQQAALTLILEKIPPEDDQTTPLLPWVTEKLLGLNTPEKIWQLLFLLHSVSSVTFNQEILNNIFHLMKRLNLSIETDRLWSYDLSFSLKELEHSFEPINHDKRLPMMRKIASLWRQLQGGFIQPISFFKLIPLVSHFHAYRSAQLRIILPPLASHCSLWHAVDLAAFLKLLPIDQLQPETIRTLFNFFILDTISGDRIMVHVKHALRVIPTADLNLIFQWINASRQGPREISLLVSKAQFMLLKAVLDFAPLHHADYLTDVEHLLYLFARGSREFRTPQEIEKVIDQDCKVLHFLKQSSTQRLILCQRFKSLVELIPIKESDTHSKLKILQYLVDHPIQYDEFIRNANLFSLEQQIVAFHFIKQNSVRLHAHFEQFITTLPGLQSLSEAVAYYHFFKGIESVPCMLFYQKLFTSVKLEHFSQLFKIAEPLTTIQKQAFYKKHLATPVKDLPSELLLFRFFDDPSPLSRSLPILDNEDDQFVFLGALRKGIESYDSFKDPKKLGLFFIFLRSLPSELAAKKFSKILELYGQMYQEERQEFPHLMSHFSHRAIEWILDEGPSLLKKIGMWQLKHDPDGMLKKGFMMAYFSHHQGGKAAEAHAQPLYELLEQLPRETIKVMTRLIHLLPEVNLDAVFRIYQSISIHCRNQSKVELESYEKIFKLVLLEAREKLLSSR